MEKGFFKIEKFNVINVVLALLLLAAGVYSTMSFLQQANSINYNKGELILSGTLVPSYYLMFNYLVFAWGCFVLGYYVLKNTISFIQLVGISGITMSFILKLITYAFFYETTSLANQPLFIATDALGIVISAFAFYVVIKSTDIIFTLVDVAVALNLFYLAAVIFCCIFYYGWKPEVWWTVIFNGAAVSLAYLSICNTCIRISNKNNAVRINVKVFSSKENRPEVKRRLTAFKEYQEWYKIGLLSAKEFFSKGSDVMGKEKMQELKNLTRKYKAGELTEEQYDELKKEILGVK